ncbi:hypothetical protein H4R19_001943 [Coemansia spiralis]|nr:hypothetical protein H4R19_001943 [Coemansia spiralis]
MSETSDTAARPDFSPDRASSAGAPFPRLQPDQGAAGDIVAAATAAAISTVMAEAQLASQATGIALHATVGGIPAVSAMAGADGAILATLQRNAQDQVMEMMNSYRSPHSHRRRSSVEAAAAASSVLASIASSTKPYMDNGMAAAVAAAVNSQASIPPIGAYAGHQTQHAAAALLAASNMSSVVLPTIPSGTASLRNTPPPTASGECTTAIDVSLPPFAVSAFSTLSPQSFAASEHLSASIAATSIGAPASALSDEPPLSAPVVATAAAPADFSKTPQPLRRRKTTSGASAATDPANADPDDMTSTDGDDDEMHLAPGGMPMTPDAPGSGRPGSLRHLTADERRARRLQRNRLAAKECRQKKKVYIQTLEDHVSQLQDENSRLRKEISELNAKLTLSGMRASSSATTPLLEPRLPAPSDNAHETSVESLPSPSLSAKRPRVAVRSTSIGSPRSPS